jgi:hypothetical protein
MDGPSRVRWQSLNILNLQVPIEMPTAVFDSCNWAATSIFCSCLGRGNPSRMRCFLWRVSNPREIGTTFTGVLSFSPPTLRCLNSTGWWKSRVGIVSARPSSPSSQALRVEPQVLDLDIYVSPTLAPSAVCVLLHQGSSGSCSYLNDLCRVFHRVN